MSLAGVGWPNYQSPTRLGGRYSVFTNCVVMSHSSGQSRSHSVSVTTNRVIRVTQVRCLIGPTQIVLPYSLLPLNRKNACTGLFVQFHPSQSFWMTLINYVSSSVLGTQLIPGEFSDFSTSEYDSLYVHVSILAARRCAFSSFSLFSSLSLKRSANSPI